MAEQKKKVRQPDEFDWKQLDKLCAYKASLEDCAEIMGVSDSTISRNIRRVHDNTFEEYRDKKMATTKIALSSKAITMGLNGDRTMLIFSLKNICRWSDNN